MINIITNPKIGKRGREESMKYEVRSRRASSQGKRKGRFFHRLKRFAQILVEAKREAKNFSHGEH